MKKLFFIIIVATCFVTFGCKKTCECTETATITYDAEYEMEPQVSKATYTKEAKKCSDLNADGVVNNGPMHLRTTVECK